MNNIITKLNANPEKQKSVYGFAITHKWSAMREDHKEGDWIGHGNTEQDAIRSLLSFEELQRQVNEND